MIGWIFAGSFCVGVLLVLNLARLSGWRRIAAEYRTDSFPREGVERWVSGRVGPFLYRNLTMAADGRGIYLRTVRGTTVFHAPVFVPWEDLAVSAGRSVFTPMVRLSFRRGGGLMLLEGDAGKLLRWRGRVG